MRLNTQTTPSACASAASALSPALPSGVSSPHGKTGRLLIVSNRLPYSINVRKGSGFAFQPSTGGLVTGLAPLRNRPGNLWLGWADTGNRALSAAERTALESKLTERSCAPVYLDREDARLYYEGFSNSTLWPLLHSFPQHARFERSTWEAYERVNRRFCQAVLRHTRSADTVWVHDYHLMLLPALLRRERLDLRIGFFLHVPFPDFETFRMLPWRRQVLDGMLGADLIGFHARDYAQNFRTCCQRLASPECRDDMRAKEFPLGIDCARFRQAVENERTKASVREFRHQPGHADCKIMLSVERLDYSKGVPERLQAFDEFLQRNPEWRGRVVLVVVTVPSREGVSSYRSLKSQIDKLVGRINGKHATLGWSPIEYYYRSLPLDTLVTLYAAGDVMLVTPLRDGMNLVCKEYLACHPAGDGVLVLSELAGAACELTGALLVNPYDQEGLIGAMRLALVMTPEEQRRRNAPMQRTIACNTAQRWAGEFLEALQEAHTENAKSGENAAKLASRKDAAAEANADAVLANPASLRQALVPTHRADNASGPVTRTAGKRQAGIRQPQPTRQPRPLNQCAQRQLMREFAHARRRAVLLDYDGTLVPLANKPAFAKPDDELLALLTTLATNENTLLAIVSGRTRSELEQWLGLTGAAFVAEHGAWLRPAKSTAWHPLATPDASWKNDLRNTLAEFVVQTPGSLLEEKDFSLAWHYRLCDPKLAMRTISEIKESLPRTLEENGLTLLEGNKVIEIKPRDATKGTAARILLGYDDNANPSAAPLSHTLSAPSDKPYDFILAAGDDTTDEDLFRALPHHAWTIKIGRSAHSAGDASPMRPVADNIEVSTSLTTANHALESPVELRGLLRSCLSPAQIPTYAK